MLVKECWATIYMVVISWKLSRSFTFTIGNVKHYIFLSSKTTFQNMTKGQGEGKKEKEETNISNKKIVKIFPL